MSEDTITLALHGLRADNDFVRADVFAKKLSAFIQGLIVADRMANGGKRLHTFVVEDLEKSSAIASIREKPRTKVTPYASAVQAWDRSARAVYNGEASARHLDRRFLRSVRTLSVGSARVFDHAEVSMGRASEPAKILRVDEYLQRQSMDALRDADAQEDARKAAVYKGVATGSFDGVLQVMDSRGQVLRAKLITTAGRVSIDCVVPKGLTQEFADAFDQRVRIEGTAHYDGERLLPARVDVRAITPIRTDADLRRWRGAFTPSEASLEW